MKQFNHYYLFLIAVLILFACKKKKEEETPVPIPLQPTSSFDFIAVRHEWIYVVPPILTSSSDTQYYAKKYTILNDLGSGDYQVEKYYDYGWYEIRDTIIWHKDNDSWTERYEINETPRTILKADAILNDVWYLIISGDTLFTKVVSLSESVIIYSDTFNCVKTKQYLGTSTFPRDSVNVYSYIDKSVGIIKLERYISGTKKDDCFLGSKNF